VDARDASCEDGFVTNNDVLRRLRYTYDFDDRGTIALFEMGGLKVTREQISNWLKKDEDPQFEACGDKELTAFLDGFIAHMRGKRDGPAPPPAPLTNNLILRKIKIALNLREEDMHEVMDAAGMPLSRPEMSAFFRKPDHRHFRLCQDQILRRFLRGLQFKVRGD